ncbi:serpin family protein [Streptomyces sp. NBC_00503]|uniref:serpin family protein n=1 Tax=Streptomyces sp. NBC_00503 TaxID=2903659 RepID=UPI002E81F33B|nr:serpin family protein [Streptomyces sp. NBC_00503]WUD85048.1 proteinase inhibitor I4 serpin [Streptomyces sp. NBC_00503]
MKTKTVRAVNALTSRWAEHAVVPGAGTAFTAAGVWPLLALLADGADGPARTELSAALGIPADDAAGAARELLAALDGVRGLRAATGLWTRRDLPLEEPWAAGLPEGAHGFLTSDEEADRKALDAWAADRTGGLIERMPVEVDEETLLVLASALTLRLRWIQPFWDWPTRIDEGPWAGTQVRGLSRSTALLDRVRVAQAPTGPVTLLEVVGDGGVDVHLVLGEPQALPAQTLQAGIAAVTRAIPSTGASLLPEGNPGPGLHIGQMRSEAPRHRLDIQTVAFEVEADHDLLAPASVGLFGLKSASDARTGHFPGISSTPLAVTAARQSAMARFHAEGFEAAAVTAIGAVGSAWMPPRPKYRVRHARVAFHRPFGFLAVHRTSRLVLAAGWVADALPCVEKDYAAEEEEAWANSELEEWD